jgi:hypothetical protein
MASSPSQSTLVDTAGTTIGSPGATSVLAKRAKTIGISETGRPASLACSAAKG